MRAAASCTSCSLCRRRRETRAPNYLGGDGGTLYVIRRRNQSTLHLGCAECGRQGHMVCKMDVVRTTSHSEAGPAGAR